MGDEARGDVVVRRKDVDVVDLAALAGNARHGFDDVGAPVGLDHPHSAPYRLGSTFVKVVRPAGYRHRLASRTDSGKNFLLQGSGEVCVLGRADQSLAASCEDLDQIAPGGAAMYLGHGGRTEIA